MIQNIKIFVIIVILIFTTSSSIYSQQIILNSNSQDTIFGLTKEQSKFLIERYYKSIELSKTNDLKDTIIILQDSNIISLTQINGDLLLNLERSKFIQDYMNQQILNKDIHISKIEASNDFYKTSLKITIPLLILESLFIYLQNK